jgi:predicted metal-binding membrane protein
VSERREAFAMGIAHGAFCVGCCWSLMLVMFGVGLANVTAMLVLGGITAVEKNLPAGRRLTHPLGVILVLAAVYSVAA